MPQRTINDAIFAYYDENGRYLTARRGETVDIPEGLDIERGDKFGAFTKTVGEEPAPPADSTLPDIEADWTPEEYVRFVDAGHSTEILTKLSDVAPEDQARVAQNLIEAEHGRGAGARQPLLTALAQVSNGGSVPTDASGGEPLTEETTGETSGESESGDLVAFVDEHTVDEVLARAEAEPELANALLEAEQAGKARKGITDVLGKTEQ